MDEKYGECWERVRALDDKSSRGLLCFVYGWCRENEEFLEAIEAGLPDYEHKDKEKDNE